jgi:transposase
MHHKPRLCTYGRQLIVERLQSGRSAGVVAEELGVSRATVYTWWRRFQVEGEKGLVDRSSRPQSSPSRLSAAAEPEILELRLSAKLGPHQLASCLGRPCSTCYKVLRRHGLHRLDWMDRPSGRVIRRHEWERPQPGPDVGIRTIRSAGSDGPSFLSTHRRAVGAQVSGRGQSTR